MNGAAWVTEHLADAIVRAGLGARVWTALNRIRAVPKSSTAPLGRRPTAIRHYESLDLECAVREPGFDAGNLLLVDDVVTKGRTLLAAASRLHEACPNSRIRAFALLRTMGFTAEIDHLLEPCIGEIRWIGGDALRIP